MIYRYKWVYRYAVNFKLGHEKEKAYPTGDVYMDIHFKGYSMDFGYTASLDPSLQITTQCSVWDYLSSTGKCVVPAMITSSLASST